MQKFHLKRKRYKERYKSKGNPYEGLMAYGWDAFHRGMPYPGEVGSVRDGGTLKGRSFRKGWMHAKLARDQGKRAL